MDFNRTLYRLSDVLWAINEDYGVVRPCIKSEGKYMFLIEKSKKALTDLIWKAELRKLSDIKFNYYKTEFIYATELKSIEGLSAGFYGFPVEDLKQESYLDFCAKVYNACKNTVVTFTDLLSFQERVKNKRGFTEELETLNIKSVSLNDLKKLTEEIKNGEEDL